MGIGIENGILIEEATYCCHANQLRYSNRGDHLNSRINECQKLRKVTTVD